MLSLFKRQTLPHNKISAFASMIATEESRNFKHLFGNKFKLRRDQVYRFVLAELCFLMETDNALSNLQLQEQYYNLIKSEQRNKTLQQFLKLIFDYHRGIPRMDKALLHLTMSYIMICWSVPEQKAQDPELLGQFSIYLGKSRKLMRDFIVNQELTEIFKTSK